MIQHFTLNPRGESYHSIMEHDGAVVGACTAVPYEYSYHGETKTFAYLGGLFVKTTHRKDPLAMFKLYKNIKVLLEKSGVDLVMAVPNDNAFPYFQTALKWKETAKLPYYALPVRPGSIKKSIAFLDTTFPIVAACAGALSLTMSRVVNKTAPEAKIKLTKNEPLMERHRYTAEHKKFKTKNYSFFYRTVKEQGIKTSYLIDFYNETGRRDRKSLAKAVNHIRAHESPDIILFIGEIGFFQLSLAKVPRKYEPRTLHFCVDVLDKESIAEDVFDYSIWEFGLYNFDVR